MSKPQPRTITSKLYPGFIRNNANLKRVLGKEHERIFPRIGLDNCEEKIDSKRKIVFSGSGNRALWDIATMSMRGISSCQSWIGSHREKLIGSMADPYCGIIYITTGKETSKGLRMAKRALVRFVVNDSTQKPALLIERIYPIIDTCYDFDVRRRTYSLFESFLARKTNNRYPIIAVGNDHAIPMSYAVSEIPEHCRSYRDSDIDYVHYPDFVNVAIASVAITTANT